MPSTVPGAQSYRTIETASKRTGELYVIKLYSDASAVCSCAFGVRAGVQIEGKTRACKHVKTVWLDNAKTDQENSIQITCTTIEQDRWQVAADFLDLQLDDFMRYAANELAERVERGNW
ncbi:MAG: hypothetical protein OXF79_29880 [Chloroflexi bacterium]|nr:hypothetical protein [Chloroflexota bacterium]